MKTNKSFIPMLSMTLLLWSCAQPGNEEMASASGFVTTLGNDTLAMEQFKILGNKLTAEVVLRSPSTVVRSYEMDLDDEGQLLSVTATYLDPKTDSITRTEKVVWDGDSLRVTIQSSGESERAGALYADKAILPFIDMVHWPFDLMLSRGFKTEGVSQHSVFSGTRSFEFELNKLTQDSITIKHPSRGTMGVTVDAGGKLVLLDAGLTTRRLRVKRTGMLDLPFYTNRFAALDQAGQSFGGLSGRGESTISLGTAEISIDYGTPAARGREIWGELVSFGQRWRTGANRATHFNTTKDLEFGDLKVPAGEYTLFTIPDADGGLLIINKQTGQNGRSYDESQDLGHVKLTFRDLDEYVEVFTISVEDGDPSHFLKLQWANKELVTQFIVVSE